MWFKRWWTVLQSDLHEVWLYGWKRQAFLWPCMEDRYFLMWWSGKLIAFILLKRSNLLLSASQKNFWLASTSFLFLSSVYTGLESVISSSIYFSLLPIILISSSIYFSSFVSSLPISCNKNRTLLSALCLVKFCVNRYVYARIEAKSLMDIKRVSGLMSNVCCSAIHSTEELKEEWLSQIDTCSLKSKNWDSWKDCVPIQGSWNPFRGPQVILELWLKKAGPPGSRLLNLHNMNVRDMRRVLKAHLHILTDVLLGRTKGYMCNMWRKI